MDEFALNILDCTLRDGGYYNAWDFDPEVVKSYLNSVATARVDYVELGLRNFPKSVFCGAYAYTTEQHINSLDLPEGPVYGVMVDAKTLLSYEKGVAEAVEKLFVKAEDSKVDLVRVAAHFSEVESCGAIAQHLASKGYRVGFNLMQSGGKPDSILSEYARLIRSWEAVEVLYFADSLGNMDTNEVTRIANALKREWDGPLGIHTHNNMGQGLENSLAAKRAGVEWLDTTITGMGRGAGNTPTESLLSVLDCEAYGYQPKPIYDLVIRHFEPLQKKYGWGSNLLYFLGAQNNVHPTYIQNLLADTHYGPEEIVGAIDYLSQLDGTDSYSGGVYHRALNINTVAKSATGSNSLSGAFAGREVLIVSNGPSLSKYRKDVELYIKQNSPVVLSVNTSANIDPDLIDYYCVSHNTKFLSESSQYANIRKPLVLPMHRFNSEEQSQLPSSVISYGLQVENDCFEVGDCVCTLPHDLTLGYALSIAINGQSSKISLVGIDGYSSQDPRQNEMISLLQLVDKALDGVSVSALTPTSYPIAQGSIYAPNL